MVKTLGAQEKCPQNVPFAMFFAVEPAFATIPEKTLEQEVRYNPALQINDESQLGLIVGGKTTTSVKRSTNTGPLRGDRDDDTHISDVL